MKRLVTDEYRENAQFIALAKDQKIYPYCLPVSSSCANRIVVENREHINLVSNNYLGFSDHPKVKEAARAALDRYGVGAGGSPLMCGNTDLHIQLKEKIAAAYGQEDAALFASGYQALVGAIQTTVSKADLVLLDALVHRSIVDGVTLNGSNRRMWLHNDMEDLSSMLVRLGPQCQRKLIVVDSVYSMDGDIADLPGISNLSVAHDALVLIDEAHALGVLGKNGHGLPEHFGLPNGADVIAGTFSKFAGAVGGFVTGPSEFILRLRHTASAYIFSASLPAVICGATLKAFELLEEEPQWRERLWDNTRYMLNGLKTLGFDTGCAETPVIPIMIRDMDKALQFNRASFESGVYASPVLYPAVAPNKTRMRLGVMATHTREDLDTALDVFAKVGKQVGLI